MAADATARLLTCGQCGEGRVIAGLAGLVAADLAAQGLPLPCTLTRSCCGTLAPSPPPAAPLAPRPLEAYTGRHAWACHACKVPLLFDYLYGFPGVPEKVPCPGCGADQLAHARRDWPRGSDGAQPMNLQVFTLGPAPPSRASPLVELEMRAVTLMERNV